MEDFLSVSAVVSFQLMLAALFGLAAIIYVNQARKRDPLSAEFRSLSDEYAETQAEVRVLSAQLQEVITELYDMQTGVQTLSAQLEAAGITPAWHPSSISAGARDRMSLLNMLVNYFDRSGIEDIAFTAFNIAPDELSGSTRTTKARELVLYARRNGRIKDLSDEIIKRRPILKGRELDDD